MSLPGSEGHPECDINSESHCEEVNPLQFVLNLLFFKRFYLFLERGMEGKVRERRINVWLPLTCPLLGTWPATQACAMRTGNQTWNPLVCRPALNPLNHASQVCDRPFKSRTESPLTATLANLTFKPRTGCKLGVISRLEHLVRI